MTSNGSGVPPGAEMNIWRRLLTAGGILLLIICMEFVLVLYASGGHWLDWPTSSDYFDQQADAFIHGQFFLRSEPDSRLAILSDPYDKKTREGIPTPTDVSYYQGHYYLYWGPVPSIGIAFVHSVARGVWGHLYGLHRPAKILALIRSAANLPIGDNIVTFVSATGIMLFAAFILLRLRKKFFPFCKPWIVLITIAAVVLGSPLPWLLNRPLVYEAAIASGQLFLLAGVFVILPAWWDAKCHPVRLAFGSTLWALALGSRISLVGAVGALVCATLIILFQSAPSNKNRFLKLASLGIPILMGIALLGAFNYFRFGNSFESGFRYQLGAIDATQPTTAVFSFQYIFVNLYNYFARGISIQQSFPFLIPTSDNPAFYPLPFSKPALYYVEPIAGIFLSAPILFCMIELFPSLRGRGERPGTGRVVPSTVVADLKEEGQFRFLWISLLAAVLLAFAPLVVYWYCTERFLLDFVPLALILSACGAWKAVAYARTRGQWQSIATCLVAGSAFWTVAASLLLDVTGYGSHW